MQPVDRPASRTGSDPSPQRAPPDRSPSPSKIKAPGVFPSLSKVFTPGPGAYSPATDRFGSVDTHANRKPFAFGSARARPENCCITSFAVSPGPVYFPDRNCTSMLSSPPRNVIGRRELGTRCSLNAGMPSNCPHWNPGPGDYKAQAIYKGGFRETGRDAPKTVFGNSEKLVTPQTRFSATVFISNVSSDLTVLGY